MLLKATALPARAARIICTENIMDTITISRINRLHPAVRQEALDMYNYANKILLGKNVRLRFAYTLRTFEEQDALYAQGRTRLFDNNGKRLGKVTNARGGESLHNYGLAFDIVLLIDKDGNGTFETASWNVDADNDKDGTADWKEIVSYFKGKGWTWGGNWKKFPDYPHFEKTYGHTWQSLKKRFEAGNNFAETIEGNIYKWVRL